MKDLLTQIYGDNEPVINVLDNGFVRLVDCMPSRIPDGEQSADYAIAEAARCSYKRGTKTIRDDKMLIRYLMRHDHTSPLEMIELKFHIKLPIFVARQWIRHRTASVNEMSGRYSEMPEEFYIPQVDNLRTQSTTNTQGSEGTVDADKAQAIIGQFSAECEGDFKLYREFLDSGVVRLGDSERSRCHHHHKVIPRAECIEGVLPVLGIAGEEQGRSRGALFKGVTVACLVEQERPHTGLIAEITQKQSRKGLERWPVIVPATHQSLAECLALSDRERSVFADGQLACSPEVLPVELGH